MSGHCFSHGRQSAGACRTSRERHKLAPNGDVSRRGFLLGAGSSLLASGLAASSRAAAQATGATVAIARTTSYNTTDLFWQLAIMASRLGASPSSSPGRPSRSS